MSTSTIEFEGAIYDLQEFSHPGGSIIQGAYNTDATATIHSYHPNVDRVKKAIAPYKLPNQADDKASYKGPLYNELKRRVHTALKGQSSGANFALRVKMVFVILMYILSFLWLAFSEKQSNSTLLAAASLGISLCMVGMNVMHDASHMAIETSSTGGAWLNYVWQFAGEITGISTLGWRYLHVIQHHIHTDNLADPDVTVFHPFIRSLPDQKHLPIHYLQVLLLIPVTCGLMVVLQCVGISHIIKGSNSRYDGLTKPVRHQIYPKEWGQFAFCIFCLIVQWGMLLHKGGLVAWAIFCICGSNIFASFDVPGHYTTHTPIPAQLPPSIQEGDVLDTWLLYQLYGTNSFSTHLNGITGGTCMQIEHHLFPRFSHRHYPMIGKITKEFCQEHGLPYNGYSFAEVVYGTVERLVILSFPPKHKAV